MTITSRPLNEAEKLRIQRIEDEFQRFFEQANLDEEDKAFVIGHFSQLKAVLAAAFRGSESTETLTKMTTQQLHAHLITTKNGISSHLHRGFNKPIEQPDPHLMRMAVQYLKFIDAFVESLGIAAGHDLPPRT